MEKYALNIEDIKSHYFHFTFKHNLNSIEEKGLEARRGHHAELIEESNKVFFVEGLENFLILFDSWITVYKKIPIIFSHKEEVGINRESKKTQIVYRIGARAMRSKFFPMFLVDFYFWIVRDSKVHDAHAYSIFDELLENCIVLNLDLKQNEDFSYDDIDEIKGRGFRRRHLITLGYSLKYSDMNSNHMDRWNMHTKSGRGVSKDKIKLCTINGSADIKKILTFIISSSNLDLEEICPNLAGYLKERNLWKHKNKA